MSFVDLSLLPPEADPERAGTYVPPTEPAAAPREGVTIGPEEAE